MSKESGNGTTGDSLEKLRALQITSLEEEEDDEDQVNGEGSGNFFDEDDDEEEEQVPVTLGFVEKPKKRWSLLRQLFPSKAGGSPAWLDPIDLPSGRSCLCDICGEPLQFLLQVYAPLSEKDSTFHRSLYIFMCQSMGCLLRDQHEQWKRQQEKASRSVKVFRCQLARLNPYYSSEPPRRDGTDKPSGIGVGVVPGKEIKFVAVVEKHVIAQTNTRLCTGSQVIKLNVYTREFLLSHLIVAPLPVRRIYKKATASNSTWPEYEILNEDEPELDTEMSEDSGHANALVPDSHADETVKSLLDKFEGDPDRKSLASFQERMARAPEQVLRYCRFVRAKPLWPMSSGRPSETDIPKCTHCGGSRNFEFQILPQLLYYFGVKNEVDSIDWATIVVYSCEASCEGSRAYKEEFVWVQLASQSSTVP
ncbi:hypothetical protein RHSIM_Rhsim13G0007900 [Rhododendron simsii]|uniref:Programmed cell death protein 2 C-terminal domain-containing protein n=1 Tax=Rhododendron simsii TaxID=118357 RepID=A0A834FY91_RHOSS|nr:hypothetical protein RHSIM_Rhsim13G0007900 [Rhododendron simsii]